VPVVVVELDALRSELATLDENIVRYELTELERAEMEARRREIYETLYPLAKYKVRRQSSDDHEFVPLKEGESDNGTSGEPGSALVSQPHSTLDVEVPPPYTRYAAEREGVTDRTIQKRLRIAEKLYPEVRDYIRGTPLADDQRGLLRLTRLEDPELQLLAARLVVEEGVPSGPTPGVFASGQGLKLHHAPHPPHHPDGLEGEGGVPLIPRHETPRALPPPGFPEVEPIMSCHEVDSAVLEDRLLLHDEVLPGADGPDPAVVHSAAPDLVQSCASHEGMVAQGRAAVKRKNWWNPPPGAPGLRMD
jgi:hypothetical protein